MLGIDQGLGKSDLRCFFNRDNLILIPGNTLIAWKMT